MGPLFVALLLLAGQVPEGTLDEENIVKARAAAREQRFTWASWSPESFARAKREGKVVLVDCAAEWCHWCHVMDETTYRDPRIGEWLAKHAVTIRVDIDERPDLAERYGDWGWPATILLSPDAEELGKFRGYLAPERLLGLLEALDTTKVLTPVAETPGVKVSQLADSTAYALERLAFFADEKEGSWGLKRKVAIGMNVQWELAHGTKKSLAFAELTLRKQRALIDPVWGGISQYSAATDWGTPHFEKLMSFQAANLEASSLAYALTKKREHLDDARSYVRYLSEFLRSGDGDFFVNQDADVNAHDRTKPFVDGNVFYALGDAERRKLGVPWVDTHVYGSENGRAVVALSALLKASSEGLELARCAAERVSKTHVLRDGSVLREASEARRAAAGVCGAGAAGDEPSTRPVLLLDDAAWVGLAFARLGAVTGEAKYVELAKRIAQQLLVNFGDPKSGALWERTVDPDAVGVFSRRTHPFSANVTAARLLAAVGEQQRGREVLAGVGARPRIENEWAWVGDFLLAAKELDLPLPLQLQLQRAPSPPAGERVGERGNRRSE